MSRGTDASNGYDARAAAFMASRSRSIGVAVVRRWARLLPAGGSVLDLGCGSGVPVAEALIGEGLTPFGVDASPRMVAAFAGRFPRVTVVCEPVETSRFFDRKFDGVIAIGLVFLLGPDAQRRLISRVAGALATRGRLLFTAPALPCTWRDNLTGGVSTSLGADAYRDLMANAGLAVRAEYEDEGGNHYYDAVLSGGADLDS